MNQGKEVSVGTIETNCYSKICAVSSLALPATARGRKREWMGGWVGGINKCWYVC